MSTNNGDDLTSIKVALARIEERQESALHKVRNVDAKIDGLVVKLDKYVEKEDLTAMEARLAGVEATQTWIMRSAMAGATALAAALYTLGKKLGFVS